MVRKIISVICIVGVLLVMPKFALYAEADTSAVRNRKIVSVVYDDSGSMTNEKWEYTSYAMQCFAAMLNKEDILDITYMSSYTSGAYSVDTRDRGTAVNNIRGHKDTANGTPVESIDAAFSSLESYDDKNVNTQYWLIVITDGEMQGPETAEQSINEKADKLMPNGTKPNIVFVTICDTTGAYTPNFTKSNIISRPAKTAAEINEVISNIASGLSGRYELNKDDIKVKDDTTVEIRTDLPLVNIGVLTQSSPARVVGIIGAENQSLKEESNIGVALPELYADNLTDEDKAALKGNVALYRADNGNIPAGTYEITFSEKISREDMVIMFEPAFELRLEVFTDEDQDRIDDLSVLLEESEVDIKATLYEIGTDNKILPSMLPSGGESSITLNEDGMDIISEQDLDLNGVILKGVDTRVEAKLEIPGFFTVVDTILFHPQIVNLSDMTATIYYDNSERRVDENGNADPENVVYITDLENNATGVKFTLYIADEPIDKARALAIKKDFEKGLNLDFENYKVSVCDDGTFIVAPTETRTPAVFYWLFHKGDSVIEASYGGKTASDTINFKIGDWGDATKELVVWLAIFLLVYYVFHWIFFKKHFKTRGMIKVERATERRKEYKRYAPKPAPKLGWLAASGLLNFFGLRKMRKKVYDTGFYVYASSGGYILRNVKDKWVSTNEAFPSAGTVGSASKEKDFKFSSVIYVSNGETYYKIMVVKKGGK